MLNSNGGSTPPTSTMINNMYMWVLDFEEGTVHKYEVTDVFWDDDYTHEDFLIENDHNASNCEWMLTPSSDYNGFTD